MRSDHELHTIVIGGGLAGLAAATYLARGGRRVTLLEKASMLGGRAISDAQYGYVLNRGIHGFYTGGAASDVLRELGVTYSSGSPKNVFALDSRGFHRFPADAISLFNTTLFTAADKLEALRLFIHLPSVDAAQLRHQSVADWISANSRSARMRVLLTATARVSLYSAALDLASADLFISRLQQSMKYPIHYIEGGWQTLVDGLHDAARNAGVDIRTSAGVSQLQFRDTHTSGVQLHDGTEIDAGEVVLALPLSDAQRLISTAPITSPTKASIEDSVSVPVACLDLALSQLPSPQHPVVFHLEQPLFASAQSEFAHLAPTGSAVVHAIKQLDPRTPTDPHADRTDLEHFMDAIQPGWRDHVVEARFLPHIAAAGALPVASRGGLAGRVSHDSGANVYLAGDWVGPRGWLVDASLDSARAVAQTILGRHASTPSHTQMLTAQAA
jgi:phytoene dehydrogenase-like protein